ncbi:MAG: helix-hairpin-helix domain-containing protein [Phycisphaerales bacterium]|nr:helix-hairpin-helix domain-containing protein [Phycisphaerales bacterium]
MMRLVETFGRTLGRVRRSIAYARRGSVLIFVVVLLVLLALIGTAFISTARTDRYATQQNAYNTQIDLLAQGVQNMVANAAAGSLFGSGGGYRQASDTVYHHRTDFTEDVWLAARVPTLIGASSNLPAWPSISWPLTSSGANIQFEDPTGQTYSGPITMSAAKSNVYAAIGSRSVTLNGITSNWPAIWMMDATGSVIAGTPATGFLAADADGDGIADSGYFKLPIGQVNGATWFAAVRIIDDNSAINAATAWSSQGDFAFPTGTNAPTLANNGFFLSNIGLMEFLADYRTATDPKSTRMTLYNQWRFNNVGDPNQTPVSDTNVNRADFQFTTQGDALNSQLGRRLDNPGYDYTNSYYRAPSLSETLGLASRFVLRSSYSGSTLEQYFTDSLYNYPKYYAYAANQVGTSAAAGGSAGTWFYDNFDFDNEVIGTGANIKPLRALLVTRNPVSNLAPVVSTSAYPTYTLPNAGMKALNTGANAAQMPRAAINTTAFDELWRAFWMVMSDAPDMSLATPTGILRPSIRDVRTAPTTPVTLSAPQMAQVRSGLAALNALGLRDSKSDIYSQNINIGTVNVMLYSNEAQPFITEVYANDDNSVQGAGSPNPIGLQNPNGYVSIELYNPYSFPINLTGWQLGIIDRHAALAGDYTVKAITGFTGFTQIMPANSYLVLENYDAAGGTTPTMYRPIGAGATTVPTVFIANLHEVLENAAITSTGGELVLLRPRMGDGSYTFVTGVYDEGTPAAPNLSDLVPLDSYDFTGLIVTGAAPFNSWHYVRPNGPGHEFDCVYPGPYTTTSGTGPADPRHRDTLTSAGTIIQTWDPTAGTPTFELAGTPAATFGAADATGTYTNPYPPIQLSNADWAGWNKLGGASNKFPFGAFARNGDILQVPFIGAYRIQVVGATANTFTTLNAITMDTLQADDGVAIDDLEEPIGRFCSISSVDHVGYNSYDWAGDIFDYLTVQSPNNDFLPDVDQGNYNGLPFNNPMPDPVGNVSNSVKNGTTPGVNEDAVPIHGQININTASWKVLSALPLVVNPSTGQVDDANATTTVPGSWTYRTLNAYAAREIVKYRLANGPFKSLFDLNKVGTISGPSFQNGFGTISTDPDDNLGDLSPFGVGVVDGVRNDFEERNLQLTRISNLVTTRSDAFTCYVLLQGWQNVGTTNAKVVAERRFAFIVDRSGVTPTNSAAIVTPVPSD